MSRRDEYRLYAGARAETIAYLFPLSIPENRSRSSPFRRRPEGKEGRFGTSYCRNIQRDTDISSQAHFARMSDSISIDESNVRRILYLAEGFKKDGPFTKAQESRDIRNRSLPDSDRPFDDLYFRHFEDNDDRSYFLIFLVIPEVGPCQEVDLFPLPFKPDPGGQLLLNPPRIFSVYTKHLSYFTK